MDTSFSPTFFTSEELPRDAEEIGSQIRHQHFSGGSSSTLALSHSQPLKKTRYQPPNLEDVDVIALSPISLMAKNRFPCDVCNKGFNREQNLELHRRGHNLPWNLKTKDPKQVKRKVYLCPEPSCPHSDPSRSLGDLTGIKKHFLRKHGEKKHECEKCNKKYAVRSDYNAHLKTCRKRSYTCDCGTVFSRRDSFIRHQTLCALARLAREAATNFVNNPSPPIPSDMQLPQQQFFQVPFDCNASYAESSSYANSLNFGFVPGNGINCTSAIDSHQYGFGEDPYNIYSSGNYTSEEFQSLTSTLPQAIQNPNTAQMSFTALLQSGIQYGSTSSTSWGATNLQQSFVVPYHQSNQNADYYGTGTGTGHVQDVRKSVPSSSSLSIYGSTNYDRNMEAQYFADRVDENIAAFGGEGTWFSSLKPDAGPTSEYLTNVGGVGMKSSDLQAGNTDTSWPRQNFGDPDLHAGNTGTSTKYL